MIVIEELKEDDIPQPLMNRKYSVQKNQKQKDQLI